MAKGTKFGSLHSVADLRLIQQSVKITPAKPRLNLLDVPGANGKVDLTEANGAGVTFESKKYDCIAPEGVVCTWSPAEYPTYWQEV